MGLSRLRVVAIADTHGLHEGLAVPDGDLLVHGGDLTRAGDLEEVERFDAFLAGLPQDVADVHWLTKGTDED